MTNNEAIYRWIDLALVYGRYDGEPYSMYRMRRKADKALHYLNTLHPAAERTLATERRQQEADTEKLRAFAGAVGLWARAERQWLRKYFPDSLIDKLAGIAPPVLDQDPVQFTEQYITALLQDARPTLECRQSYGRLQVSVEMRGVHLLSTKRWLDWLANPVKASECVYCGNAYHPTRSDARYCCVACRTAAARDRNKAAAMERGKKWVAA